jgi:predicted dehydrogenase
MGFIGLGGMGRGHTHIFRDKIKSTVVHAGVDPSPESRKRFMEEHPGAKTYENYKDMLADNEVDAVLVASPTFYHRDAVIDIMKSGRHVLSEKPLGRTVKDCHAMIKVAEKTGKVLMVAHCRRFDTDWGTIRKVITEDKLGGPVLWRHLAGGVLPTPWFVDDKLSGGPMLDGAIHDHDFGNWVFGDPDYVIAHEIRLGKATGANTVTAIVQYKAGHQMVHCWSWDIRASHLLDLLGPKGSLLQGAGPFLNDKLDTKKNGYYHLLPHGGKPKLLKFKRTDMYVAEDKHFIDCINGKAECRSPATEAIKGVAVGEAIINAARGKGKLKVSW